MTGILAMSVVAVLAAGAAPAPEVEGMRVQQCLHGADSTPEQKARRNQALGATRAVNNMQANQPGASAGKFLRHEELAGSPSALKQADGRFKSFNLAPGQEILPGWALTLDVTVDGYWFLIKDKTDPCGFTLISNKAGLIYTAEPLR